MIKKIKHSLKKKSEILNQVQDDMMCQKKRMIKDDIQKYVEKNRSYI